MCFNVSIRFKMGSLLLWYNNKLVYPPELSRIAGFCTNSNKIFWGRTPRPLFLAELFEPAQISPSTIFLANSRSNGLCMSYLKSPLLIIFSWMDVWTNKEKSLKTPWKCTSKVLEKSLKKVCHDLWEPCFTQLLSIGIGYIISEAKVAGHTNTQLKFVSRS